MGDVYKMYRRGQVVFLFWKWGKGIGSEENRPGFVAVSLRCKL